MIALREIIKAVAAAMADFAPVYSEYPQNMEAGGPPVIVCVAQTTREELTGGGGMLLREILVTLHYRGEQIVGMEETYAFQDACAARLWPTLDFAGRRIMPQKPKSRSVDGVSQFSFTLTFVDSLSSGAGQDPQDMETLSLRQETSS